MLMQCLQEDKLILALQVCVQLLYSNNFVAQTISLINKNINTGFTTSHGSLALQQNTDKNHLYQY